MDMFLDLDVTFILAVLFGILSLLISFISIFILNLLNRQRIDLHLSISFAAGVFIGLIFIDLFPEIIENGNPSLTIYTMSGFLFFSVLELIMGYHEKHHLNTNIEIGYMDLLSDLIHNFIDGFFIMYSFRIDYTLGILAGIGVLLHEIPQEVSDYIVLTYSGFTRNKAILFNVLVSTSTIAAILIAAYAMLNPIILISFMAGNYIYLATVDLIPEVSRSVHGSRRLLNYVTFVLGIITMYILEVFIENLL